MSENLETWAKVDLMGHVSLAGRVTKPGEYGGLWQIDIPEGDTFRTEFFGTQSVYRIQIVSEQIARAFAASGRNEVIEYNAAIITREEHLQAMEKARSLAFRLQGENEELKRRLTAVRALPEVGAYLTELEDTAADLGGNMKADDPEKDDIPF